MSEVKLKDIAEAVGVSVVTVSNALSGKKGVSEEVRILIEKTAQKMGYDHARYMKKLSAVKIGVITSEIYLEAGMSFYWAMYQQVAYEASRKQGLTMFEKLTKASERQGELPRIMKEKTIDGLIIVGWVSRTYIEKLVDVSQIPIVLLDFEMKGIRCDAVMSSNYIGMYKATRYLLERGHRDIAFVGSIFANENIMDRYYGYRKGLSEAGIRVRPEWLIEDRDLETGCMEVELPDNMPSAFACNSDVTAGLLYDALTEKGFNIPRDVSIAGYDNYHFGHVFADKITTYNVDMRQMAAMAVKLLLGKVRGSEKYWGTRYIDSVMIERGSVRSLPDKR